MPGMNTSATWPRELDGRSGRTTCSIGAFMGSDHDASCVEAATGSDHDAGCVGITIWE
jgi:hypothetical protein